MCIVLFCIFFLENAGELRFIVLFCIIQIKVRCSNVAEDFISYTYMQIKFAPVEYVQRLSGTIGQAFGSESRTFVASLQIGTNIRTYGPYGRRLTSDDQFSIPLPGNVSVVGFFGRAGNLLDAIGVYIAYKSLRLPIPHDATEETSGNKDEETPKNTTVTAASSPSLDRYLKFHALHCSSLPTLLAPYLYTTYK